MTDEAGAAPKRPMFAIFEGGGARGVAHVGAMDAIAANYLEIIGVGGTSAGALVDKSSVLLAATNLEPDGGQERQ
jgi:predicted acylesterase/phospholipase RssA